MVCKHTILKLKLLHLLKSRLCFKHFKCKYPNNPNICAPKSSLGSLRGRVHNFTEKWILHLSIPRSCQNIHNSYFPQNFLLESHQGQLNCEERASDRKLRMLWIWFYPVSKKELLLKLAAPKKLAKSLKTICEKLRFFAGCRTEILFTCVSQGFSKTRIAPPMYME